MSFTKVITSLATLLLLSATSHAYIPSKQSDLESVQVQIKTLESTLSQQLNQEKTLQHQLEQVEKALGEQAEKIRHVEKKMDHHEKQLNALYQKQILLKNQHAKELQALSAIVKNLYVHQKNEKMKLFFHTQDSPTLTRFNEYYKRFYQTRAEQIDSLQKNLVELQLLQEPILKEQELVHTLALMLKKQLTLLEEKKSERQNILASLAQDKVSTEEKIYQLQEQEKQLSHVVHALQESLKITPAYIEPIQEFAKMKRKLHLPIQSPGSVLAMVPYAKKENAKRSYIEADLGTPVSAIFPGKVVFAEWLRGIGLLIIVDHGNGYMSLYGNNEKLYKSIGDWVNQGDMIARVGQSGGHAKAGLYFEIRKDGEALDPTPWFEA